MPNSDADTTQSNEHHEESIEFNDDGELWAAGRRDLSKKLESHYGVERILLQEPYNGDEGDFPEAMVYWDGDGRHLLSEFVPVFGHSESGAVGVSKDDLPSKEKVNEVVESA